MPPTKKKFSIFPEPTISDWTKQATKEINGQDPWIELSHDIDKCTILPIYSQSQNNTDCEIKSRKNNYIDPQTWYNCSHIYVENEESGNKKALYELENGADGILFEIHGEVDFKILLKNIEWPFCSISFDIKKNIPNLAKRLGHFIEQNNWNNQYLHGAFFSKIQNEKISHPTFRWSGVRLEEITSPIDEIVMGFQSLGSHKLSNYAMDNFAISVNISRDFFLSIAKIRAIRKVWNYYLKSNNQSKMHPLFIHGYSSSWQCTHYGPHENMLKGTTVALSSIIGGCDAITIYPENDSSLAIRMSRNISNILRFESHCNKVFDPVAGSYFLENLTRQLASKAWEIIESKILS